MNTSHVSAEEARVAWLGGWEPDFTKGHPRCWVRTIELGAAVKRQYVLRVYRHDDRWCASYLSLACNCAEVAIGVRDGEHGRQLAESMAERSNRLHEIANGEVQ